MTTHRFGLVRARTTALVLATSLASAYACGGSDEEVTAGSGSSTGKRTTPGGGENKGGSGQNGGKGGGIGIAGAAGSAGNSLPSSLLSLAIDPPTLELTIDDAKPKLVPFKAIGTLPDGSKKEVTAAWAFDRFEIALMGPTGQLSVNGQVGGTGTVTASFDNRSAAANVKINVVVKGNGGGGVPGGGNVPGGPLTDAEKKPLDDAPPGPGGLTSAAGTLVYPYDKTVFARGLIAPELMWNGGANGDAYLIHLSEPGYEAKLYAKVDAPGRFVLPQSIWDAFLASNHGDPAKVRIVRSSGGKVVGEMTETWTIAQGSLRGTIYYWTVNKGQLVKISPGADHPELAFDSGDANQLGTPAAASYDQTSPPWTVGTDGKRCVACHTVSRDGSRLMGIFERKANPASPFGTVDLAKQSVVQMGDYQRGLFQPTLTPNGSHGVLVDGEFALTFADATSGKELPTPLTALAGKAATPMFSPDGRALAFSSEVEGSYPVEFSKANLSIVSFDPPTLTFSAKKQLAAGEGQAIAFPSFTPDSAHVIYQKGSYSRAKYGTNEHGSCDLFVTDVGGSGAQIELGRASGKGLVADRNLHISYEPRVNPIAVGGYAWVVFVSPRDYGNRMVSTNDPTYENRKQIWVAAVDLSPKPGTDPSHPAFLLRGQDTTTTNMSGYWTLDPCRSEGTSCSAGYECCSGFCRADANGKPVCVLPPGSDMPGGMGEGGKTGNGNGGSSSAGGNGSGNNGSGSNGSGGNGSNSGTPGNGNSCSQLDEKCSKSSDCCESGYACIGGFCGLAGPK